MDSTFSFFLFSCFKTAGRLRFLLFYWYISPSPGHAVDNKFGVYRAVPSLIVIARSAATWQSQGIKRLGIQRQIATGTKCPRDDMRYTMTIQQLVKLEFEQLDGGRFFDNFLFADCGSLQCAHCSDPDDG